MTRNAAAPDVGEVFHVRLGYGRWLAHLRTGEDPGNVDIARALKVTGPWVTKWSRRADAPDSRQLGRALAEYLQVDERWLLEYQGEAPEPELWARWKAARESARARKKSDVGLDMKGRPAARDEKGQRGAG